MNWLYELIGFSLGLGYVFRPSMQEVGGSIPISANPREVG